jgi:hypothetical protein
MYPLYARFKRVMTCAVDLILQARNTIGIYLPIRQRELSAFQIALWICLAAESD